METFEQFAAASDLCRILSMFLYLPSRELAAGLADGTLRQDLREIFNELGWKAFDENILRDLEKSSAEEIFHSLRQEYTRLFTHPDKPQIYIYEALFKYTGGERPLLYVNPAALDAKRQYSAANFQPSCKSNESADHMGCEIEFYSFLCFRMLKSPDDVWKNRLEEFFNLHLERWGEKFFRQCAEKSELAIYRLIGNIGAQIFKKF